MKTPWVRRVELGRLQNRPGLFTPTLPAYYPAMTPPSGDRTLELIRGVMLRAGPLSEEERDAFVRYSVQLRRSLDAVEERLEDAGEPTISAKTLRYLLEALPGITV